MYILRKISISCYWNSKEDCQGMRIWCVSKERERKEKRVMMLEGERERNVLSENVCVLFMQIWLFAQENINILLISEQNKQVISLYHRWFLGTNPSNPSIPFSLIHLFIIIFIHFHHFFFAFAFVYIVSIFEWYCIEFNLHLMTRDEHFCDIFQKLINLF